MHIVNYKPNHGTDKPNEITKKRNYMPTNKYTHLVTKSASSELDLNLKLYLYFF